MLLERADLGPRGAALGSELVHLRTDLKPRKASGRFDAWVRRFEVWEG